MLTIFLHPKLWYFTNHYRNVHKSCLIVEHCICICSVITVITYWLLPATEYLQIPSKNSAWAFGHFRLIYWTQTSSKSEKIRRAFAIILNLYVLTGYQSDEPSLVCSVSRKNWKYLLYHCQTVHLANWKQQ